MNKLRLFTVVPAALVMSLAITQAGFAEKPEIQISRNFQPDPLVVKGTSRGTVASNCGNITATPTQVIQITESLPYLRLTVESQGNPTLLINGPGGRFCVLADKYSGGKAELSGYWQAGKYSLHIGNSSQGQQSYTLSISQQNK